MARYQKKPTLEAVAARRNQSLAQLITEWGVTSVEDLMKRCKREGVDMPTDFTFAVSGGDNDVHVDFRVDVNPPVKNALVTLPQESEDISGKKGKRGKLTPDEPVASVKHVGVDPSVSAGPKDPA